MSYSSKERAEDAEKWLRYITEDTYLRDNIEESVRDSKIYDSTFVHAPLYMVAPHACLILENTDTVTALFSRKEDFMTERIAVLNFASFKNPGGGYRAGMYAQEEALCSKSTLYPILNKNMDYYMYNREHLNRGLYENRALLTPCVAFEHDGIINYADVLTCAAPNRSLLRYGKFTEEENEKVMHSRIVFIKMILESLNYDSVILGAWGCGVFKQKPSFVAETMYKEFGESSIPNVIFAIPSGPNFDVFKTVLGQTVSGH